MAARKGSCLWPRVILFGDSITQQGYCQEAGWVSEIANRLIRKCDVVNRGFSGYNTRSCKLLLPSILKHENTDNIAAFTVFLGANDSNDERQPAQRVPISEYQQNLVDMVNILKDAGVSPRKVILITPPPVVESKWEEKCQRENKIFAHCDAIRAEYVKACVQASAQTETKCVDLYTKMRAESNWADLLSDGLHLSPPGAQIVADAIWAPLDELTQSLPLRCPEWSDIDNSNPQASLAKYLD